MKSDPEWRSGLFKNDCIHLSKGVDEFILLDIEARLQLQNLSRS
jgi:hypothetical protein